MLPRHVSIRSGVGLVHEREARVMGFPFLALSLILLLTFMLVTLDSVAFAAVSIVAKDAKTGASISNFKWVINLDNSHANSSVTPPHSYSPVVATGNQANASGIVLNGATAFDRGYLVTVYANDGVGSQNAPDYKICGTHFGAGYSGNVVVECQPNPLPLATLKVRVFHDNGFVNGEWDQNP